MEKTMKNRDQIISEMQAFKKLSPAEQAKERKKLGDQREGNKNQVLAIQKEIQSGEKRKKDLEDEITLTQKQLSEARDRRVNLFAQNMDTKDLDAEIWKLQLDIETQRGLRADKLTGLDKRISDLKEEIILLGEESAEIERMLLRFDDIPRVAKVNQLLASASNLIQGIAENQESLGYAFHRFGGSTYKMIHVSEWDSLDAIPKLYLDGDIGPDDQRASGRLKHTWSIKEFHEENQRKRERAALEKVALEKSALE